MLQIYWMILIAILFYFWVVGVTETIEKYFKKSLKLCANQDLKTPENFKPFLRNDMHL